MGLLLNTRSSAVDKKVEFGKSTLYFRRKMSFGEIVGRSSLSLSHMKYALENPRPRALYILLERERERAENKVGFPFSLFCPEKLTRFHVFRGGFSSKKLNTLIYPKNQPSLINSQRAEKKEKKSNTCKCTWNYYEMFDKWMQMKAEFQRLLTRWPDRA